MVRASRSRSGLSNTAFKASKRPSTRENPRLKRACALNGQPAYIDASSEQSSPHAIVPNTPQSLTIESNTGLYSLRARSKTRYVYVGSETDLASSKSITPKPNSPEIKTVTRNSQRIACKDSVSRFNNKSEEKSPSPKTCFRRKRYPQTVSSDAGSCSETEEQPPPKNRLRQKTRQLQTTFEIGKVSDGFASDEEEKIPTSTSQKTRYPRRNCSINNYSQFYKTSFNSTGSTRSRERHNFKKNKYNLRERSKAVLDRIRFFSSSGWALDPESVSEEERPIRRAAVRANGPNDGDVSDDGAQAPVLPVNVEVVLPSRPHITLPAPAPNPPGSFSQLPSLDDIGGLGDHIRVVKEAVFLPNYYPELCSQLGISPTRGILFHGPPGTGKTLMAQALLNECSHSSKPIAFFHIHASDILSKWVGKSESKIQTIFRAARVWQPSVIFIDEIDGLVPCRSSTDRHNASLVGALLSQMDGLEFGGHVLVLGSTNRIHSIDPALRRAGRFEVELYFPMPDRESRFSILNRLTQQWDCPVDTNLLESLADRSYGFSGADLSSLCSKAARRAISRCLTSQSEMFAFVQEDDFAFVFDSLTPTSQREHRIDIKPLPKKFAALTPRVEKISDMIRNRPVGLLSTPPCLPTVVLVSGKDAIAVHCTTCAILHSLDNFSVTSVDLAKLAEISDSNALDSLLNQASRNSIRKVILIRNLDIFLDAAGPDVLNRLKSALLTPASSGLWTFLFTSASFLPEFNFLFENLTLLSLSIDASH